MKILAIIPARSGSKRLKNKNFLKFNKKPLFLHIVDKLKKIKEIKTILISTDSHKISKFNINDKKVLIEKRKRYLSGDKATVLDVVYDIVKRNEKYDIVGYFLPTCPLTSIKEIQLAIKLLKKNDFSVSIKEFEDPIELALRYNKKNNRLKPLYKNLKNNKTNSRFLKKSFRPTGSFYFGKRKSIMRYKNFFSGKVAGVLHNKKFIDINDKYDFKIGEFISKNFI